MICNSYGIDDIQRSALIYYRFYAIIHLKVGDDMKKLIAFFMCLVICVAFVGCNNTDNQNDEAREALQRVLENEQTFTAQTTEYTLEKYHFQINDNAYYVFVPEQYAFVDMDNDNIDELVILDSMMNYYLVLHYENEKVNGYRIDVRSLIDLRTDGSFMTSSAAGINSIGNMCFDGSECKVINKALANDYDQEYFIDGKKTDQKTSKKYFDDWNENTTKISWNTIN